MDKNEARIDKWLWAARIFKTRTIAAAACKKGQVSMKGVTVKPSHVIHVGDIIDVRLENVTPPEQYELLEISRISGFVGRAKGTGRPTKKDRRSLDTFTEEVPEFFGDFAWEDADEDDEEDITED